MTTTDLYNLTFPQLTEWVTEQGLPRFRSRQIWEWLYQKFALDFEEMTNLSKKLRVQLSQNAIIGNIVPDIVQKSSDERTEKILFRLPDGEYIETVLMRYEKRRTICISTQVGCAMGCVFCATGQMGFKRNLTVSEIVAQVTWFGNSLAKTGERITNVVMMGMGEPLHNYDNTLTTLDRLIDGTGINLGARKITISTVGMVPAIRRYADEQRQTPLAVSLHAATDEERSRLIPVAKRWPLDAVMDACRYYIDQTGRRLTFEWALIKGKNDTDAQAHALGNLIKGLLCHVNLIPLNPTRGFGGGPSTREQVDAFREILEGYGVSSTVRVRRGIDIQAGCGQLRERVLIKTDSLDISS